jgi:hypothetical protein
MPSAKKIVHPAEDDRFDAAAYRGHNERDPRALSGGPCEDKHLVVQIGPRTDPGSELFSGNQSARWVDCAKCGLRMGTYPFKGNGGKTIVVVDPSIVEEALTRIKEMGMWNECSKKLVDGMIKIIEGERQVSAASTQNVVTTRPLPMFKTAASQMKQLPSCAEPDKMKKRVESAESVSSTTSKLKVKNTLIVCQICNDEGHGARDCPELIWQYEEEQEDL